MNAIRRFLLYVTNNETRPRHEPEFDVFFFVVNTIALVVGSFALWYAEEWQWIAFLVIEYTWALDNMRHNRP